MSALSAHVQVQDRPLSACDPLLRQLRKLLQERYQIAHTTIQFECAGCGPDDLYCALEPGEEDGHDHAQHHHERIVDGLDVSAVEVTKQES